MRMLCYALMFTLAGISANVYAAGSPEITAMCRKNVESPKITISVSYDKLRYDFSKDNRALTRLNTRRYGKSVSPGKYVRGLSTYDLNMNFQFDAGIKVLENGVSCIYPTKVDVSIYFQNPTIYISRNLQKGTCEYDVTMRHEQTHQQINLDILEYYLPIIRKRFTETVKNDLLTGRNGIASMTLAQENFKKILQKIVDQSLDDIKKEMQREQQKLDTQEHYDYEADLCK